MLFKELGFHTKTFNFTEKGLGRNYKTNCLTYWCCIHAQLTVVLFIFFTQMAAQAQSLY